MSGLFLLIFFAPTVLGTGQSQLKLLNVTGNERADAVGFQTNKVSEITTLKNPVNATVIEKSAPKFLHPDKMLDLAINPAGSTIRLKCKTEGNPTPNITWYKDGEPIERRFIPAYYRKWSVILEELTKNDSGNYLCVACNELGCINHTINLLIQERYLTKPFIREQLRNITATLNDTVSFSCETITDLEPFIQWTWRSPNTTEELVIQSDDPNDKPEMLTIHSVTADSEGWYKCITANTLGQDSSQGYLRVVDSYLITEELGEQLNCTENLTTTSNVNNQK